MASLPSPPPPVPSTLPDVGLAKSVSLLWHDQLLFDYTIEVEGQEFKVHKVIMASISDFFRAALTGGMAESKANHIKLEGQNAQAVSNIIEYVYTNKISGAMAKAEDFLESAVFLQIPSAIETAINLVYREITIENCFEVLSTFQLYHLEAGIEKTRAYIRSNVKRVLRGVDLSQIPVEHVYMVIELWNKSEMELFEALERWINADREKRTCHKRELVSHVEFRLLTPANLQSVKEHHSDISDLIDSVSEYRNLPVHKQMMDPPKVRNVSTVTCFSHESGSIYYTLNKQGTWKSKSLPGSFVPDFSFGVAAVTVFKNYLIVCGSSSADAWHVFDPRSMQWHRMANMGHAKRDFALVHDNNQYMYVIGGQLESTGSVTDSIERFDIDKNRWEEFPSRLPLHLHGHLACMSCGIVYVTGGWITGNTGFEHSKRMDALDLNQTDPQWQRRAPLASDFKGLVMHPMKIRNEAVLVVLHCNLSIHYYRPNSNQWVYLDKMRLRTDFECGAKSIILVDQAENALYLLNSSGENQPSEEDYDYESDDSVGHSNGKSVKWVVCPKTGETTEQVLNMFPFTDDDVNESPCYIGGILTFPKPQGSSTDKLPRKRYNFRNANR